MDEVEAVALERRPRLILAGWSAYPRVLDFPRFRAIADEVGAYLLVDMSHFAGLVAAGLHPNPVPFADVVTTTIYKTLGGTRGGMILSTEPLARTIAAHVHAGPESGVLAHEIAGKAVTLGLAASDSYRERQERALAGARAVAGRLLAARHGIGVLTGGTDGTWSCAICATRRWTASAERPGWRRSGSPSAELRCRSTRARTLSQRPADRDAGAREPGTPGQGLRRGGRDHRRRPEPVRVRRPARRPCRAGGGDHRPLPAELTAGGAGGEPGGRRELPAQPATAGRSRRQLALARAQSRQEWRAPGEGRMVAAVENLHYSTTDGTTADRAV